MKEIKLEVVSCLEHKTKYNCKYEHKQYHTFLCVRLKVQVT